VGVDAIELLTRAAELEGTAYLELQAGPFTGDHWKDGSAFIREQVFGYVEPVFVRHLPGLNPYGPSHIGSSTCRQIVTDLRTLGHNAQLAKSIAELREAGVGFSESGLDAEFEVLFRANADAVAQLACNMADWIEDAVSRAESVSILGL
jgi:hypothetical protein